MGPNIIALVVVLLSSTSLSSVISFLVMMYRIIHPARICSGAARMVAIILSYFDIRVVRPPISPRAFAIRTAVVAAQAAAFILFPVMVGLSTQTVDQASTPQQIGIVALEQQEIRLPDGTELTVSAGARLRAKFEASTRIMNLDAGEVRFKVAKDPNRPFFVETAHATAKVLGTDFTVSSQPPGTHVQVHEGRVQVFHKGVAQLRRSGDNLQRSNSLTEGSILLMTGGDEFVSADGRLHDQTVVNATQRPRYAMAFRGELLRNVVDEINRHHDYPFVIVDGPLGEQAISGILDPRDRKSVIDWLKVFEVRVEEDAQGRTLLYAEKSRKR